MGVLNAVLGAVFDAFFAPLASLGPWPGMIAVSVITGILMLLIFKKTSNQEGIRRAKNQIKARLLEIRLFKNDTGRTFKALGAILAANVRYMGHALRPMLVMIIPVLLILAQLNLRFGSASLPPGGQAVVKLTLADGVGAMKTPIVLRAEQGLTVETPPVRIEEEGEVDWRIRGDIPGRRLLTFDIGGTTVEKIVSVGQTQPAKVPTLRTRSFLDLVLYPGEKPLPKGSPAAAVEVIHPSQRLPLFGGGVHWLVAFFVLSLAAGFALKGVFKVEI
ncbi:MAG: hypothetical protein JW843_06365 [Candidatus Aminicenantes bacterium]|nr:hypothetical protein [Candidatus Aminicenantes bacterium]